MEGDDKFADRYRIESTRLAGWDYGDDGWYFVTICAKDRIEYFGRIANRRMILSPIGEIVREELLNTVAIRKNIRIDIFQIMPNHLHVIFIIDNDSVETAPLGRLIETTGQYRTVGLNETPHRALNETPHRALNETPHRGRLYKNGERGKPHPWHKTEWQPNSLGSIINQFKSVCTKRIRKINPSFAWQSRFYDHVIPARNAAHSVTGGRSETSLNKIRQYIITNPPKWEHDRNNPRLIGGQAENIWM